MSDKELFERVATYLENHKGEILEDWKVKMKQKEPESPRLIALSQENFLDHLPKFLDNLIDNLRGKTELKNKPGMVHGAHRWENDLDLRQLISEWGVLQEVLIDRLDHYLFHYSDRQSFSRALHKKIINSIHTGISSSVDQYYRLENRKAEAQMRDLEVVFEQQEKDRETQKRNLRQTSHDLKGHLLSLQIALKLLKDRHLNDLETTEIIQNMESAAENLNFLLTDLLDLFRLEAGQSELNIDTFDVAVELRQLCEGFKPMAENENLELNYGGDERLIINNDVKKVKRVAQNLILNSLNYTDEGLVKVTWNKENEDQWRLIISDTGPGLSYTHAASLTIKSGSEDKAGMPATEVSAQNSDDNTHGEGIGLLIVRELCSLMDAVIKIETTPGEGTTFEIVMPVNLENEV